ncbi:MAG: hypothetical protein QNJ29_15435 [Rhizobiaceae bacterium]|nr:hypothetical protein [Rhizobiaceae bacterium]
MQRKTKIIAIASVGVLAISGIAFGAKGVQEHREMHRIFSPQKLMEQADTNKDNAIALDELEAVVASRFGLADTDSNGSVTKGDVIVALEKNIESKRIKRRSGRIADRLFAGSDINEDGNLTKDELSNRIVKMHALVDWNDDGKVSRDEIKRIRTIMPGKRRHQKGGKSKTSE